MGHKLTMTKHKARKLAETLQALDMSPKPGKKPEAEAKGSGKTKPAPSPPKASSAAASAAPPNMGRKGVGDGK